MLNWALVTPIIIAFIGYWISTKLNAQEQRFEAAREEGRKKDEETKGLEQLEREARKEELHRLHTPRIELKLECQFFGVRNYQHLATFSVLASNAGQVFHKFERIILRARGIKDEPFKYRQGKEPYAYFPHKLFETNLVPEQWNFIFIEPGVTQRIPLTTLIPADYTYVL